MEPENLNQETPQVEQVSSLHQVTPFSKYLALSLFIVLPFVGGYIGYTFAPEKMVEVEKVTVREVPVTQTEELTEHETTLVRNQPELRYYNDARDTQFHAWIKSNNKLPELIDEFEVWSMANPLYEILATSTFQVRQPPAGAQLSCLGIDENGYLVVSDSDKVESEKGYLFEYYRHEPETGKLIASFTIDKQSPLKKRPCILDNRLLRNINGKMSFIQGYTHELTQIDITDPEPVLTGLPYNVVNDLAEFNDPKLKNYVVVSKHEERNGSIYLLELETLQVTPLRLPVSLTVPEGFAEYHALNQGVKVTSFSLDGIKVFIFPCKENATACAWENEIEVTIPLDLS